MRRPQTKRRGIGYVTPKQINNNVGSITNVHNTYSALQESFEQSGGASGGGLADVLNLIPPSDESARPSYPGEKHALLKLPNGKMGIGNYIGPGTHVIERLKRGDPPRTLTDKTAKRHDIDYTLASGSKDKATQNKLIREADERMVSKLKSIEKHGLDSKFNTLQGKKLIQAKMKAEDIGILKKGSFGGDLKKLTPQENILLKSKKEKLQMEGFGHPAGNLKKMMLRQARKESKRGDGLRRAGGASAGGGLRPSGGGLNPSGGAYAGGALMLAGQRGLTPKHMRGIKKICTEMKGDGLGSILAKIFGFLGKPLVKKVGKQVLKEVGKTVLKDVVAPVAKKKLESVVMGKKGGGHAGGALGATGAHTSKGKTYGVIKGHEMRGKGIKLPGGAIMGKGDLLGFVMKKLIPSLANQVGIDVKHIPMSKIINTVQKAIEQVKGGDIAGLVNNLSKVILPILTHGKAKALKIQMAGAGAGILDAVKTTLPQLAKGIWESVKWFMTKHLGMKGKGLNPSGGSFSSFFKGFASVFKKIFKPVASVAGTALSAVGFPELGIPLDVAAGLL